jgi:hypothetical protein
MVLDILQTDSHETYAIIWITENIIQKRELRVNEKLSRGSYGYSWAR